MTSRGTAEEELDLVRAQTGVMAWNTICLGQPLGGASVVSDGTDEKHIATRSIPSTG